MTNVSSYCVGKGHRMVEISFAGDSVVFEVKGWDKFWSLHSRLTIPASHIISVHADPTPAMGWFEGIKLLGTGIPNIFRAGTFFQDGEFVFWDVRNPENTIVVELEHENFRKLIVEVENPAKAISLLELRHA